MTKANPPHPPVHPAGLLDAISEIQAAFQRALSPQEVAALPSAPPPGEDAPVRYSAADSAEAVADFELTTAAQSLELLLRQVQALVEQKQEAAYRDCLEVYYATEQLARDTGDPAVVERLEAMRRAHEHDYGRPVPPKTGT